MPRVNDPEGFSYRVDFAARIISNNATQTRSFDSCFENHDGDAVAVAVYRRSLRNPRLRANIWSYIDRHLVVTLAFKNRRLSQKELGSWAADLRRKSREDFARMMAEQEDRQKANAAAAASAGYTVKLVAEFRYAYVRPDGSQSEPIVHESSAWHFAHQDMIRRAEVAPA